MRTNRREKERISQTHQDWFCPRLRDSPVNTYNPYDIRSRWPKAKKENLDSFMAMGSISGPQYILIRR